MRTSLRKQKKQIKPNRSAVLATKVLPQMNADNASQQRRSGSENSNATRSSNNRRPSDMRDDEDSFDDIIDWDELPDNSRFSKSKKPHQDSNSSVIPFSDASREGRFLHREAQINGIEFKRTHKITSRANRAPLDTQLASESQGYHAQSESTERIVPSSAQSQRTIASRKSRSVSDNIFGDERIIYNRAKLFIEDSIWHVNPFPVSHEIEALRAEAWQKAMTETNLTAPHSVKSDKHLSAVISTTRSHLVSCVKENIQSLYQLDQDKDGNDLSRGEIAQKVSYLLDKDRFLCDPKFYEVYLTAFEDGRRLLICLTQTHGGRFLAPQIAEVIFLRYYDGPKKIGHREPCFMDKFNNIFICLVSTAIYHHLKLWDSGIPDHNGPEFKAEVRWSTFIRHLNTWTKIPKDVKGYIMRVTKTRILTRLQATGRAHIAEDTDGFQDGEDAKSLMEYMKTQLGTAERLTIVAPIHSGPPGEVVIADVGSYEIDDDVEVVFNSNPPSDDERDLPH